MTTDPKNPLNMISDPYAGDGFVLSETNCTDERILWFRRSNEILGFLMTTELSLKECKNKYTNAISQKKLTPNTPFKIESSDGRSLILLASRFLRQCDDGLDVLCRQVFVMLYGSLETYFFQLMERSFLKIGKNDNILDHSLDIMMRKKWDAKLCKMRDVFGIRYKASELRNHFKFFEMNFEGTIFKDPLQFLDELTQIRHRIVHASSIWQKDRLIFINAKVFHAYYAFCAHLTDYTDSLFSERFGFNRISINPAEA